MGLINMDELLCIKGRRKSYAFEIPYITEICSGVQISKIPCLPGQFSGACSHKGEIVPVIRMEDGEEDGTELVLIVRCQGFSLGIVCQGLVHIMTVQEGTEIQRPETEISEGIWAERALVQTEDELYTVIDLEKTVLGLAKYFQEEYLYI